MNTRTLEYIISIYETGSFVTASEKCFVSQPALSMQIKKFEEYLGLQIFERDTKNILITKFGEEVVKRAYEIINEVKNLDKIASLYLNGELMSISLGAFPTLCQYLIPKILPIIKKQLPNLSISIVEEKTDTLIKMLEQGEIDFILLAEPIEKNQLISKKLFDDELFVAISTNHEFADKKNISTNEIIKQNLMILDEGHCLRIQTLKLCSLDQQNFNNGNNIKGSNLETLRQMVSINEGITIIPKIAMEKSEKIKYLNIRGRKKSNREIFLVMRKSSVYSQLFEKLANIISENH